MMHLASARTKSIWGFSGGISGRMEEKMETAILYMIYI